MTIIVQLFYFSLFNELLPVFCSLYMKRDELVCPISRLIFTVTQTKSQNGLPTEN